MNLTRNHILPATICAVSLCSLPLWTACGDSLILCFIVPGTLLATIKGVNTRHYAIYDSTVTAFAGLWDLAATTWLPVSNWVYPAVPFFIGLRVGNSPIEIVVLFGLAGATWCDGVARVVGE